MSWTWSVTPAAGLVGSLAALLVAAGCVSPAVTNQGGKVRSAAAHPVSGSSRAAIGAWTVGSTPVQLTEGLATPANPTVGSDTGVAAAQPSFMVVRNGVTVFTGVGAEVEPADPSAAPTVSEKEALALLARSGLAAERVGNVVPRLVLVEYQNVFGAAKTGGGMTPSVPRQLAWFATYSGVPDPLPHSRPAGSTLTFIAPTDCFAYAALSASTGQLLDSFDHCGPN